MLHVKALILFASLQAVYSVEVCLKIVKDYCSLLVLVRLFGLARNPDLFSTFLSITVIP